MSDSHRSPLLTADDLISDRALSASDPDQLEHAPIAERVAELVTSAEAPVNVALFGPWGSGKSSFAQLLKRALGAQTIRTELIVYNTWTSAGESFQRSFISNAATELGFRRNDRDGHDFHAGLYERKRGIRVSGAEMRRFFRTLGTIAAIAFLLIGGLAWLFSWLTGTPFGSIIPTTLPPWVTASGVLGLLGALLTEGLAGAKVDVETSAPTQEQFRQTFRDLIARARIKHKAERLVFFLDELDRCQPDQVVEVLSAVKHFLDQPSCVFIVAADREVMERALPKLPQATPVNIDAPYYSSASEFIDKVFQHQLSLPPLRMRRLSRFARDLIEQKATGIWKEIAGADADGRRWDEVLYVAVPRHVRSPRRVKVLLNNFATNARVAQARGIDWLARAVEIAKLTALQTEFPLLAADLHREPRLLTFLLQPPSSSSPRLKRLLEKHRLPLDADQEAGGTDELDVTPTDRPVVKDANDLELVQRRQLLSYLRGTSNYRNPGHDLLFLEDAGKAVDLSDPAFAEVLEASAIEEPAQAIAAAEKQSPEDQGKALGVLADLVTEEVGRERANATTALLGVARLLKHVVQPREHEVVAALRLQHRESGFDDGHLPDVLPIALKAGAADLAEAVLSNEKLWATPQRVGQVAAIADQMPKEDRPPVWERVGAAYATSDDALVTPLIALDATVAEELLDSDAVRTAIANRLAPAAAGAEPVDPPAPPLFAAIAERSDGHARLQGSVMWDLLATGLPGGYAAARESIQVLDQMDAEPGLRNACALVAMEKLAPINDFPGWTQRVQDAGDEAWDDEAERALKALVRCFTEWTPAAELGDSVPRLMARIPAEDDERAAAALSAPLETAMGSAAWWATNEDRATQQRIHEIALSLHGIGSVTAAAASAAVLADVTRAVTTSPRPNNFQRALSTALAAARRLVLDDLDELAVRLAGLTVPPDPLDLPLIKARLFVTGIAKRKGISTDAPHFMISGTDMDRLRAAPDYEPNLERWLELNPPLVDVVAVLLPIVTSGGNQAHRATAGWGARQSAGDRTDLLLELLRAAPDVSRWVEAVTNAPLEETRFVNSVGERLRSLTRADERTDYLRSLAAFRPARDDAQRAVADLVIWLIDQETKVDFDNALVLLPALGSNHGATTRLTDAFKRAGDRGYEPRGRALEHLHRAGVTLTKKRLSKSLWDRWRDLRR